MVKPLFESSFFLVQILNVSVTPFSICSWKLLCLVTLSTDLHFMQFVRTDAHRAKLLMRKLHNICNCFVRFNNLYSH
jgi:hypothetical protein